MKVAIVGAGIAGLRAADLLHKAGIDFTIFEARDRIGGRLETTRLPDGGFYESGGEWLDADHARTLRLINELGFSLVPANQYPGIAQYKGEQRPENEPWDDAVSDEEKVMAETAAICRRMKPIPWDNVDLADLDLKTLAEFLDENCETEIGRWWLEGTQRSDEGEDTDRVGLLGWLAGQLHYLDRVEGDMSMYRVPGGSAALLEKLAAPFKDKIELNKPLRTVQMREDAVELWFDGEMGFFDRAILTLPPKALLDVDFFGQISFEKESAWDLIGSARAIKVSIQFRSAFWRRPDWTGRMLADKKFHQIWDAGQDGANVMSAYICGDQAEEVLASPDPVRLILDEIASVEPAAHDEFVQGWVHDWINDPWAQGAFTSLAPGSVMGALPYLNAPEGLLHFAGEYSSTWTGFIEGALESAERVVEEILAAKELADSEDEDEE